MSDNSERAGSCLCGAVRVRVPAIDGGVGACHCSMCRKWTGGPMLAVECGSDVRFEGADNIVVYESSDWAERGFCRNCGSHLFYRLRRDGQYALPAGLLDDTDDLALALQIFMDEKPSFYNFADPTKTMTGEEVFEAYGSPPE